MPYALSRDWQHSTNDNYYPCDRVEDHCVPCSRTCLFPDAKVSKYASETDHSIARVTLPLPYNLFSAVLTSLLFFYIIHFQHSSRHSTSSISFIFSRAHVTLPLPYHSFSAELTSLCLFHFIHFLLLMLLHFLLWWWLRFLFLLLLFSSSSSSSSSLFSFFVPPLSCLLLVNLLLLLFLVLAVLLRHHTTPDIHQHGAGTLSSQQSIKKNIPTRFSFFFFFSSFPYFTRHGSVHSRVVWISAGFHAP